MAGTGRDATLSYGRRAVFYIRTLPSDFEHLRTNVTQVSRPHSQTLDRGLRILELIAEADAPLTVAEVAQGVGLHRSVAYRAVRTLEDHRLLSRGADGRWSAGVGLSILARRVRSSLQTAALPELSDLANGLGMTAFLVVRDADEAVTVQSVEPRHSMVHVSYRPGIRHPVDRGAPGLALLAGAPASDGERPEVQLTRERGWAYSASEVLPGMRSVAAAVHDRRGQLAGAVAVVFVESPVPLSTLGERVMAAERAIARELS